MKSVEEQLAQICRGVDAITPEEELVKKLKRSAHTGKPLRVKYGIDPTGIDVHLGHTVPLRKLRLFQALGHQAVLIIGKYTALVGDPSGRDKTRDSLTEEQVDANAKDYLKQISKIIDIDKTEVRNNEEWFSRFTFLDTLRLTGQITMQRMLERDDFTKRLNSGTPISLHECLYPLMQGHDSVEIQADIELGGSEQLFSLMVARDLQSKAGQESQICITLPILRGLDGVRRMGKSLNNYIGVAEPAFEMMKKVMRIPDDLMTEWFELLTDRSPEDIAQLTNAEQSHPRDSKLTLGRDIAGFYYGSDAAQEAADRWLKEISGGCTPTEIPVADLSADDLEEGNIWICKLLVKLGLADSNNAARRAVQGGAVTFGADRKKVSDPKATVTVENGMLVRNGKQKMVQVKIVGGN